MSAPKLATLEDIAAVLTDAGYLTERRAIGPDAIPALLAETPEAFIAVVEVEARDELAGLADQAQAALTHVAAAAPSLRMWDLYLLLHVLQPTGRDDDFDLTVEQLESDTSYARKLVRVAMTPDRLGDALRALLPIRAVPTFDTEKPLELLLAELVELGVERDTAAAAIASFQTDEEMTLP
jgi:hypothetical protein